MVLSIGGIAVVSNNHLKTDEQAVLAAFEVIQQAMINKDMDTLNRVIKDDKVFTHMSGKQQTKAEYLGEIEDGTLNYYKYQINHLKIEIDGSKAALSADVTLTAKVYGISGSWTLPTNAHFEKIGGEWIYCN